MAPLFVLPAILNYGDILIMSSSPIEEPQSNASAIDAPTPNAVSWAVTLVPSCCDNPFKADSIKDHRTICKCGHAWATGEGDLIRVDATDDIITFMVTS